MSKTITRLFIISFLLVPILMIVRQARKHHDTLAAVSLAATDKIFLEKWKNQQYTSLTNGINLNSIVGQFRLDTKDSIDREQKSALTEKVAELIACFHIGTYDAYARFRFPVKPVISQDVAKYLMHDMSIPGTLVADSPQQAFRYWWDRFVKENYKNLWTGISVSNCEMLVEKSTAPTNNWKYPLDNASATLNYSSIRNTGKLISDLRSSSLLSAYLRSQLSLSTSNMLYSVDVNNSHALAEPKIVLLNELNRIIQDNSIYNKERFENVLLSPSTAALLAQHPTGPDLIRLNRFLLADAYPDGIHPTAWVEGVGIEYIEPTVMLKPSWEDIFRSYGFVERAIIKILPQLREGYVSVPVYLFLYWSPSDKKWFPDRLVMMSSLGTEVSGPLLQF